MCRYRTQLQITKLSITNFLNGPSEQRRPYGKPRPYGGNQHQVAFLKTSLLAGRFERQRNGAGGGVAVFVYVDDDAVFRQAQPVSRRHDDALIGLMRNKQIYI